MRVWNGHTGRVGEEQEGDARGGVDTSTDERGAKGERKQDGNETPPEEPEPRASSGWCVGKRRTAEQESDDAGEEKKQESGWRMGDSVERETNVVVVSARLFLEVVDEPRVHG